MSLFNISGSADWAVSDIGEKLCENFIIKGSQTKRNEKRKAKDKLRKIKKNMNSLPAAEVTGKIKASKLTGKILNSKDKLKSKVKNKFKKQNRENDKVLLTNSLLESSLPSRKKRNGNAAFGESDKLPIEAKNLNEKSKKPKKQPKDSSSQEIDLKRQEKNFVLEPRNAAFTKKSEANMTLRQKMLLKLKAAKFRFLNEQIYTTTGKETEKIFKKDPQSFKAYHEGYKLQVKRWPLNPVDKIIKSINKMNKSLIVADFGCGEAKLAESVEQQVYSFDLVAINDRVKACDMAHVPLENASIDVAVFCLSLMGTNLKDYLIEANRVLKINGILKIAEVESRFENVDAFVKSCQQYGFKKTWSDLSCNLFYFIDFRKESDITNKKKLPAVSLAPCLYKKR